MTRMPNLEARLARVEQVMEALSREVKSIRAELGTAPSTSENIDPSVEAPRETSRETSRERRITDTVRSVDYERLLGRYGMLGIAVFAAVAAVGTFLSWAISKGYITLGPASRVVLGLVFAAAIGAWGLKLRRTERSFGSSLIGLALVIVMVVAYAAGPYFNLVPTIVAFVGAAGVAWGLAMFARVEDDEPLWCVAFGGAAIAPFVTSDGTGSFYALLAYSLMLLVFGCFGIGHRGWPVAWRVFYLAAALLSISAGQLASNFGVVGILFALAFPLVVGAGGVVPFAPDERKRAALRWLALLTVVAAFDVAHQHFLSGLPVLTTIDEWIVSSAILVALGVWLAIVDRSADVEQSSLLARNAARTGLLDWLDAAVIPLLLAYRASEIVSQAGLSVIPNAVSAVLLIAFTWRRSVSFARDAGAFAFILLCVAAVTTVPFETAAPRTLLLLLLPLGALALHHVRPSWSWVWAGALVLLLAASLSVQHLTDRPEYTQPPFATMASFVAFALTATLGIIARFWQWIADGCRVAMGKQSRRAYATTLKRILRTAIAAPWVWAFLWIYIELSRAYNPSTSMLLLVTYFAMTGVVSVAAGRMRHSALLRKIGLALAVIAAGTAVYGASTYFDSGIRIIAYLVTSAFLLGIAFWYRRTGTPAAQA